jgi:hypothetical protein
MSLVELKHSWLSAWHAIEPSLKKDLDNTSLLVLAATLLGWLPNMTIVLTFIWTCIRLYETKTVQDWLARRRARKEASK